VVEAKPNRLTITCHAATGCVDDVSRKPEDELVCERDATRRASGDGTSRRAIDVETA
jgi:hypothetical protein